MSTTNPNSPDEFALQDRSGNPLRLRREWWQTQGIYLSNVCLAVHLEPCPPKGRTDWDTAAAKADLYALLRWLGHTALEHALMRPVAGVMLDTDYRKYSEQALQTVRSWGADQEWHRGSFALYVEQYSENAINERLADLLKPTPEILESYEPKDPRNEEWYLKKIDEETRSTVVPEESTRVLDDLQRALTEWAEKAGDIKDSELSRRVERIIQRADAMEEGRTP